MPKHVSRGRPPKDPTVCPFCKQKAVDVGSDTEGHSVFQCNSEGCKDATTGEALRWKVVDGVRNFEVA